MDVQVGGGRNNLVLPTPPATVLSLLDVAMPELDLTKISKLEERLDDVIYKDNDEDEERDGEKALMAVLKDACALIRKAESEGVANLDIAIDQVDKLINKALDFAYGDSEMFDFVPSFAHSNECPVLDDEINICAWNNPPPLIPSY